MPDIRMTPGNRDPRRYTRTGLSAAVLALVVAGASAPAIYDQFLSEKEGDRLIAYQDGVGVWTICKGLTALDGIPVKVTDRLTREQCAFYNQQALGDGLRQMEKLVKPAIWAGLSEPAKAGISSFCVHNIGVGNCRSSTFLRLLNSGASKNDYCAQITRWIFDRKRDCRKAENNCQGQPVRRMQEDELCLMDKGSHL